MSSGSNSQNHGHSNPNKIHINPKFAQKQNLNPTNSATTSNHFGIYHSAHSEHKIVRVNPKFQNSAKTPVPVIPDQQQQTKMHINPNFTNRPLPSIPPPKPARHSLVKSNSFSQPSKPKDPIYAKLNDPALKIDSIKKDSFEATIKKSVENNKVLVNPNFSGVVRRVPAAGRPPSKPMRHSLMVTSDVAKHLDLQSLKKVKSSVVLTPKTSLNKENQPSTATKTKLNLFTPLRKSAFKKIGSRKLVRRKSSSPGTPKASFKKIGNKKLIRVVNAGEEKKSSPNSSTYDVKTKTKLIKNVKNTPSNVAKYKFSFITPLSMKKSRSRLSNSGSIKKTSGKKSLSSFKSRFKLDRRQKAGKTEPKVLFQGSSSKVKKLSGASYRVSATKLNKVSSKGHQSAKVQSLSNNKVITVQGVKFTVADNGRKLRRVPSSSGACAINMATVSSSTNTSPGLTYSASVSGSCPTNASTSPQTDTASTSRHLSHVSGMDSGISCRSSPVTMSQPNKKMYLGGEELEEVEPGVFTRSRHSLTRQSITQAKNRSINTIMKNATRSKQYCMFYNKFGKCTKKEAGTCPFIHDPDKIAVCRRFLQGSCHKDKCLLSHKAAPEKMPVCKFFLEGVCSKQDCPYLHVKVSEKAAICQAFLSGYCPNGSDCKLRHVMACPEFDRLGTCSKAPGKCPFPHVKKTEKKVAPAKPKRKSLGQTPADHKKSRVQTSARYFDKKENDHKTDGAEVENIAATSTQSSEIEAKRKRLLRKVELAKQGWTGVSVSVVQEDDLDDSGPYEKIEGDDDENNEDNQGLTRAPIGQLGDFISLAGYSSEDEELHTDHRLI